MNLFYLLLISLFISSLHCIGWWFASRGKTEIKADGYKKRIDDQIFYSINEYFTQSEKKKVFLMCKDGLKVLRELDEKKNKSILSKVRCEEKFSVFELGNDYHNYITLISDSLKEMGYFTQVDDEQRTFAIYYEREDFKFSKYIRKPIVGCYKCFSSFHGLPIFFFIYYTAIKNGYFTFNWVEFVFLAIIHTFALVSVNMFINKKVG